MSIIHGYTLSPGELDYINLPLNTALNLLQPLPLTHVRLGCVWSDLQPSPTKYNFKPLLHLLDRFHRQNQQVILVVGVKTPRWPEFYFPDWLSHPNPHHPQTQKHLLEFIHTTLTHLGSHPAVTHLQIENEPLDPSGPDQLTLPLDLLNQEVNLARQLSPHPIILTAWGNQLTSRGHFHHLLPLCDILGVDLYFSQLTLAQPISLYSGPETSTFSTLKSIPKPVWITELQAEPWEKDLSTHLKPQTRGFSPQKLTRFYHQIAKLNPQVILFWGAEYWAYQTHHNNPKYLDTIHTLSSQ